VTMTTGMVIPFAEKRRRRSGDAVSRFNLSLAVVRLDDVARDAAALGDLEPVLVRPLADRLILVAAGPPGAGRRGTPGGGHAAAAADPGRRVQERVERLAQLAGVL